MSNIISGSKRACRWRAYIARVNLFNLHLDHLIKGTSCRNNMITSQHNALNEPVREQVGNGKAYAIVGWYFTNQRVVPASAPTIRL